MSTQPALAVRDLGKQYRIGSARKRHDRITDAVGDMIRTTVRRMLRREEVKTFWALRNATFDIHHGESVGIIGLNGAGKSTLLKMLSRITSPTTGTIDIDGRIGALLEVGTGFHGDLTGRENIFLYGSILGMSRAEVTRKFDAIVDFSGIANFVDTPVKRYSSGMFVRLAFAVAAHLDPEILLLDEVLAVGDLPFQRKCLAFAKELQRRDAAILFVSHNMFSIKSMCERVIYLRKGEIVFDGPTERGLQLYEDDCRAPQQNRDGSAIRVEVTSCTLHDARGADRTVFRHGEPMRIRLSYRALTPTKNPNFIVAFQRSDEVICCCYSSESDGFRTGTVSGAGTLEIVTPPLPLVSDLYRIWILVRAEGFQEEIGNAIGPTMHVTHDLYDTHFGVFHERATWAHVAQDEPMATAERAARA